MEDLGVTLIQSDIHWQEVDANLAELEEKIWQLPESTDLIILPEMFNTGFTMETGALAEPMNGKTFKWMKQMAGQTRATITGSLIIREQDRYYNRLIWMNPDGTFFKYDKRHLFRIAEEDHYFAAGKDQLITDLNGWKICPLICYDLRFPVWSRNSFLKEKHQLAYDLVIYIANWPAARISAWDALLQARAIENLCYAIGVNRIGKDGNGIQYNGHTSIIDPLGKPVILMDDKPGIKSLLLSYNKLTDYRDKFPVYLDNDHFKII
jgi:omega-amidase